jgi:hypothetical protein
MDIGKPRKYGGQKHEKSERQKAQDALQKHPKRKSRQNDHRHQKYGISGQLKNAPMPGAKNAPDKGQTAKEFAPGIEMMRR